MLVTELSPLHYYTICPLLYCHQQLQPTTSPRYIAAQYNEALFFHRESMTTLCYVLMFWLDKVCNKLNIRIPKVKPSMPQFLSGVLLLLQPEGGGAQTHDKGCKVQI